MERRFEFVRSYEADFGEEEEEQEGREGEDYGEDGAVDGTKWGREVSWGSSGGRVLFGGLTRRCLSPKS